MRKENEIERENGRKGREKVGEDPCPDEFGMFPSMEGNSWNLEKKVSSR